jgi:tRNA-Thr(GGU) m(6)t(6)A37 methyltransferase TsaA
MVLVTWLDKARRDVLRVQPRGDATRREQGVFTTRSSDRPNPIGLHDVEVVAVAGLRIKVAHLEVFNGTPILDLKPALLRIGER